METEQPRVRSGATSTKHPRSLPRRPNTPRATATTATHQRPRAMDLPSLLQRALHRPSRPRTTITAAGSVVIVPHSAGSQFRQCELGHDCVHGLGVHAGGTGDQERRVVRNGKGDLGGMGAWGHGGGG